MNFRSVEFEMIRYKTHDIGHATGRLIYNFAHYSGIVGTEVWPRMQFELLSLIKDQTPYQVRWNAEGIEINFSGFLDPRPIIKEGRLVYESPEPSCVFFEQPGEVSPTLRTHIGRVTSTIAQEMKEVYCLQIDRNPLTLKFPKSLYSSKIELIKAVILEPGPIAIPQAFYDAFKER